MRTTRIVSLLSAAFLTGAAALSAPIASADHPDHYPSEKQCASLENPSTEIQGWCIAINRSKGNCLACHTVIVRPWPAGLALPGNVAPPLVSMNARYPDTAKLHEQISDPTIANPNSVMPPMGKHGILSDEEIDKIVAFLVSI